MLQSICVCVCVGDGGSGRVRDGIKTHAFLFQKLCCQSPYQQTHKYLQLHLQVSVWHPFLASADIACTNWDWIFSHSEYIFVTLLDIYFSFQTWETCVHFLCPYFQCVLAFELFSCFWVVLKHYICVLLTPEEMGGLKVQIFLFNLSLLAISLGRGRLLCFMQINSSTLNFVLISFLTPDLR